MEPPLSLHGDAREFWARHYTRLVDAEVLTDSDRESFLLLCQVWGKLQQIGCTEPGPDAFREMVQFNNLTKQYLNLAAQFGLMPHARKRAKLNTGPKPKKDEYGL